MNTFYAIKWNDKGTDLWLDWYHLGTYLTVVDAIKAVVEEYENVGSEYDDVSIVFENENDSSPVKAGDIFWIRIPKLHEKIDTCLMIVKADEYKRRTYVRRKPTTYTHPKLKSIWDIIDLTMALT